MEQQNNLNLYELISYLEGIEIPDIFQSKLDEYILGMSNGNEIAQIIAGMIEKCDRDSIERFMEALEDYMLEIMSESFVVLDSEQATVKRMYLWRLVIHYRYKFNS